VEPERHGITTNTWTPQVRPVVGLVEALFLAGRQCAFFYNWEPLRDLAPPEKLSASFFLNNVEDEGGTGDVEIAELAAKRLTTNPVDFAFVYLGYTDTSGHRYGWMSEPYLRAIATADRCIASICSALGDDWNVIVTSDHGGHGKSHGTTMPEDINTPIVLWGPDISKAGQMQRQAHVTDIAPTILGLFGVTPPKEWIGKSVIMDGQEPTL
jgi:predicted AlkP superfamily pyrophosphatase or phosphodiesterase